MHAGSVVDALIIVLCARSGGARRISRANATHARRYTHAPKACGDQQLRRGADGCDEVHHACRVLIRLAGLDLAARKVGAVHDGHHDKEKEEQRAEEFSLRRRERRCASSRGVASAHAPRGARATHRDGAVEGRLAQLGGVEVHTELDAGAFDVKQAG